MLSGEILTDHVQKIKEIPCTLCTIDLLKCHSKAQKSNKKYSLLDPKIDTYLCKDNAAFETTPFFFSFFFQMKKKSLYP